MSARTKRPGPMMAQALWSRASGRHSGARVSANPESRGSGFDAAHRPGTTITDRCGFPIRISNSRHASAFSRRDAPEAYPKRAPPDSGGRREDRVRAAPAVSCTNENEGNRTRAYRFSGSIQPSLRNGSTAYSALSPENQALLSPSPPRSLLLENLTPTMRRQDHTALAVRDRQRSSCAAIASTASHPAFRDDRDTPLLPGGTRRASTLICVF